MKVLCLALLAVAAFAAQPWDSLPKETVSETAFRPGKHYTYHFDGQISSGLPIPSASQHSITRIQSIVSLVFKNDRTALLKMHKTRVGSSQREVSEPRDLQPFAIVEEIPLTEEQTEQLSLPIRFRYEKGLISEIEFEEKEQPWSANIKRAVLNMFQVNIDKKTRTDEAEEARLRREESMDENEKENDFFTAQETTLEGDCEMAYTMVSDSKDSSKMTVTKSANYEKCSRRVDIRYNFRFAEQCPSCEKKFAGEEISTESATVTRFDIRRPSTDSKDFIIREVELRSHYTFAPLSKDQHIMSTVVNNRLRLVSVDSDIERVPEPKRVQEKQHLIYSAEWEERLEKFRMTGDESLIRETPFVWMTKKVEIARQIVKEIIRQLIHLDEQKEKKEEGSQLELNHHIARLVEVLRVATPEELKKVESEAMRLAEEKEKTEQVRSLYNDILATVATKPSVDVLVEKMIEREMSPIKASRVLKSLMTMRNPSEPIIDKLVRLCKEDVSQRNPILKQSCWLTVGSLMNGLCGENRDRQAIDAARKPMPTVKSGHRLSSPAVCPRQLKNKFVELLQEQFEKAETRYEKILSIKTMANAGVDLIVFPLEKIISDRREEKIVRLQAIDGLRQLRSVMPRKIRTILMPIYKNSQESIELRLASFHHIMQTLPERATIDQITQQLEKEPSRQVASYVYTAFKSYAKSDLPCERDLSKDIEISLRLARVQPRRLLDSKMARATFFHEETSSGLALNLAALFGQDSVLPKELTASLDTVFAGQWNKYLAQVGFAQQNMDGFLYKLLEKLEQSESTSDFVVRGKRSSTPKPSEILRQMMRKMNISPRRAPLSKDAHAMFYIRYRDMDYALLPLDEHTLPVFVKNVLKEGKIDISDIEKFLARGYRFNIDVTSFIGERTRTIPTALGLPLEIVGKMPTVFSLEGHIKAELKGERGVEARLIAEPKLASAHVVHMEIRSPIVSTGVKKVDQIQARLPIDLTLEAKWDKEFELKTKIAAPEEEKKQMLVLHSRPATYIRHENSEKNIFSPTNEKTVFVPEQPRHEIKHFSAENVLGVRFAVRGNVHRHLVNGEMQPSKLHPILVSENHLEVVMERTPETPREYVIVMKVVVSDEENRMEKPEFERFFQLEKKSSRKEYEDVFEVEDSEYADEDEKERRTAFLSYAKTYKHDKPAYKHRIFLSAQAVGSSQERKGEMEIVSVCDEEFTYCRWMVDATRSPVLEGERRQWTLKAKIQSLFPQPIRSLKQLSEQKHREVQATVEATWGSEEKNDIKLKIQAEQSKEQKKWQKLMIEKSERKEESIERLELAARLNQIKIVADYNIEPKTLVQMSRVHSLLKAWQPWSSKVEMMGRESFDKEGRMVAKISVEPQTWRFVNVSVETPSERVQLENIRLPFRPTWLSIEKKNEQEMKLSSKPFEQVTCTVSSKKVNTFDDVVFRAPITSCYSVLAKDCSKEQPKFAVLMKKVEKKGEEKKIKIITEENTIEIENKKEKLIVKVDGKIVKENDFEQYGLEKKSSDEIVFVNEEIYVRFDGYKAEMRLSELYKNQQCGICGHYDGEYETEFRKADNEETSDLEEFHRSFLVKDEPECEMEEEELSKKENYERFERESRRSPSVYDDNEEYESEEEERDLFNNDYRRSNKDSETETVEPEEKTEVIEYAHRVCFSKQPVPSCPRDSHEEEKKTKDIKVKFACLERSAYEAKELLRQVARRDIVSVEDLKESFVETLSVPTLCRVY